MPDATERKTLSVCAFITGCLLIAPGERVAAVVAWCLSMALLVWHVRQSKQEARASRAGEGPAASGGPIDGS